MSCTWSPCGRFIAAQTTIAIELRNSLTFEPLTILQSTETNPLLTGPVAYSPDGRSIASTSNTAVVIWDVQTGGVAKEIRCGTNSISMAWSLDGRKICTVASGECRSVQICNVVSGVTLSPGELQPRLNLHVLAYEESFRVFAIGHVESGTISIDVFEVGYTLPRIQTFRISLTGIRTPRISLAGSTQTPKISFSPTTSRVSISIGEELLVFGIPRSGPLLEENGPFSSHCFSSDGGLFAASGENGLLIWEYDSYRYALRWKFPCQGWANSPLQFSPTKSSILGHCANTLQLWRLQDPTAASQSDRPWCGSLSRCGNYIATAYKMDRIVKIITPQSHIPLQTIDTSVGVEELVLTGNVLLVVGSGEVGAWLLTEEGLVNGATGRSCADHRDSIWVTPLSRLAPKSWMLSVEGQVGIIMSAGPTQFTYNTETGGVLRYAPPSFSGHWYNLFQPHYGRHHLRLHGLSQGGAPPKDHRQTSRTILEGEWVKDHEGRCELWIPVEWRRSWDCADWLPDVMAQFSILESGPFIIKFL